MMAAACANYRPCQWGSRRRRRARANATSQMSAAFYKTIYFTLHTGLTRLSRDVREHRRQIRALRRARMYDMIGRRARGTQYRQRAPSACAASWSIRTKPPLCVIAAEHEHESRRPPGLVARIAPPLSSLYFRVARERSLTDGASFGGSQTTTSYCSCRPPPSPLPAEDEALCCCCCWPAWPSFDALRKRWTSGWRNSHSSPFNAAFCLARSNAYADESTPTHLLAPAAAAAIEKPPL